MNRDKNRRLSLIRQILEKGDVHTQAELKDKLKSKDFDTSSATISRDLKELGYIRIPIADGSYRVVKSESSAEPIDLLFKLGIMEIIPVNNIIIIKTKPGNAHAVGGTIDRSQFEGILGTIAGDDTILAITRNNKAAIKAAKVLKDYIE
jgi:transcriptional regulator of arginine metabolism